MRFAGVRVLALAAVAVVVAGCARKPASTHPAPSVQENLMTQVSQARQVAAKFLGAPLDQVQPAPEDYRFARHADGTLTILFELPGTERAQCAVSIKPGGEMMVTSAAWFPPPEKVQPQAKAEGELTQADALQLARGFLKQHAIDLAVLGLPQDPTEIKASGDTFVIVWRREKHGEGGLPLVCEVSIEVAKRARRVVEYTYRDQELAGSLGKLIDRDKAIPIALRAVGDKARKKAQLLDAHLELREHPSSDPAVKGQQQAIWCVTLKIPVKPDTPPIRRQIVIDAAAGRVLSK